MELVDLTIKEYIFYLALNFEQQAYSKPTKNTKPQMKTKKSLFSVKNILASVVMVFVFLASCQNNSSILTATDTQNVNAESASASFANESTEMASSAVGGVFTSTYNGGRISGGPVPIAGLGSRDDRLQCATITVFSTGTKDAPAGTVTIDFGTAGTCNDPHGVTRKGKIIVTYSGMRWAVGSFINVRLVNFYRNTTHVEGNLTLTTQTSADSLHLQFESVLDSGKVTFGDGKFITRIHDLTRVWIRSAVPFNDQWITLANTPNSSNGSSAGMAKDGKIYTTQITKQLIEKVSCMTKKVFIPVSGTKLVTVGNQQYLVNYGDGTCDNIITVTLNGKQKQITVTAEGN